MNGRLLKILIIGDLHGEVDALLRVVQWVGEHGERFRPDLVLFVGDFVSYEGPSNGARHDALGRLVLRVIRATFGEMCDNVLCVPGNHDRPEWWRDQDVVKSIDCLQGGDYVDVGGFRVVGIGGSWPIGGFPYEWSEGDLEKRVRDCAPPPGGAPEIILSHAPPVGCGVDITATGNEVGSTALAAVVEARRPKLFISGHIHEAAGWGVLGDTYVLNAGLISYRQHSVRLTPPYGSHRGMTADVWEGARLNFIWADPLGRSHRALEVYETPDGWRSTEVVLENGKVAGNRERQGDRARDKNVSIDTADDVDRGHVS